MGLCYRGPDGERLFELWSAPISRACNDVKRTAECLHGWRLHVVVVLLIAYFPSSTDPSCPLRTVRSAQISFDPRSRFARPGDQLILSWRTPLGAGGHRRLCPCSPEKRQGDDTDRNGGTIGDEAHQEWPGVGDSPPLILMAETLSVRFVSATVPESSGVAEEKSGGMESVGGAWGFRLTASGREVMICDAGKGGGAKLLPEFPRRFFCSVSNNVGRKFADERRAVRHVALPKFDILRSLAIHGMVQFSSFDEERAGVSKAAAASFPHLENKKPRLTRDSRNLMHLMLPSHHSLDAGKPSFCRPGMSNHASCATTVVSACDALRSPRARGEVCRRAAGA